MELIIGLINAVRVVMAIAVMIIAIAWPWGSLVKMIASRTQEQEETWFLATLISIFLWIPSWALFGPIIVFLWPWPTRLF